MPFNAAPSSSKRRSLIGILPVISEDVDHQPSASSSNLSGGSATHHRSSSLPIDLGSNAHDSERSQSLHLHSSRKSSRSHLQKPYQLQPYQMTMPGGSAYTQLAHDSSRGKMRYFLDAPPNENKDLARPKTSHGQRPPPLPELWASFSHSGSTYKTHSHSYQHHHRNSSGGGTRYARHPLSPILPDRNSNNNPLSASPPPASPKSQLYQQPLSPASQPPWPQLGRPSAKGTPLPSPLFGPPSPTTVTQQSQAFNSITPSSASQPALKLKPPPLAPRKPSRHRTSHQIYHANQFHTPDDVHSSSPRFPATALTTAPDGPGEKLSHGDVDDDNDNDDNGSQGSGGAGRKGRIAKEGGTGPWAMVRHTQAQARARRRARWGGGRGILADGETDWFRGQGGWWRLALYGALFVLLVVSLGVGLGVGLRGARR